MKNKIFSFKLYFQGIKKIKAVGIAATICITILNALIPIIALVDERMTYMSYSRPQNIEEVMYGQFAPFGLLMIAFVPLMVYSMFSYLNSRSKSDFYHSLPQTRECFFVSFVSAILTWVVSILLLTAVVNTLLWNITYDWHLSFSTVGLTLINYFVLYVLMTGFMCLAMTLTGTAVSNVLVFALVGLFVRAVATFFIWSLEETSRVYIASESWMNMFSIENFLPVKLVLNVFDNYARITDVKILIYSFVVGVALLFASCLLYKARRSEMAGQSAPNKKLQTVYRSAVTFPFLLIMVYFLICEGFEAYQIIIFAISFVVYMMYELLTTKSVKAMVKSLSKFAIPVLASFVFFCGVAIANECINSVQPEADEIKSIALVDSDNSFDSYENRKTANISVSSDEAGAIISRSLKTTVRASWAGDMELRSGKFLIELNNGRQIARRIYIVYDEYMQIMDELTTSEEYLDALIKIPKEEEIMYTSFSGDHSPSVGSQTHKEVYALFAEEYSLLTKEKQLEYKLQYKRDYHSRYDLHINVNGYTDKEYFSSRYLIIPEYFPKTATFLAKLTNEAELGYDSMERVDEFYRAISGVEYNESRYFYCTVNIIESYGDFKSYELNMSKDDNGEDVANISKEIVKLLAENEEIFNYEDPVRKLYFIDISFEYNTVGEDTKWDSFYQYMNGFVMLTESEFDTIKDLIYSSHLKSVQ